MPCDLSDFKVGSRDVLRLRFIDEKTSAATRQVTRDPIDLTTATGIKANCRFTPTGGTPLAVVPFAMSADSDQVLNKGFAEYRWGSSDLVAGKLEVEGEYTMAGFAHFSVEV